MASLRMGWVAAVRVVLRVRMPLLSLTVLPRIELLRLWSPVLKSSMMKTPAWAVLMAPARAQQRRAFFMERNPGESGEAEFFTKCVDDKSKICAVLINAFRIKWLFLRCRLLSPGFVKKTDVHKNEIVLSNCF